MFNSRKLVKLKDIADIRSGYSFRGRIKPAKDGAYRVVQIKDLEEGAFFASEDLIRTNLPDVNSNHLLKEGDVLFTSRGVRRQAVVADEVLPNTIFGSQFFVCDVKKKIEPAYLAWYMNQTPAQRYFEEHAAGTNVRIITKDVLGHLVVNVPPIEVQKKIVEIHRLSLREKKLLEEIQKKRSQLIESVLINLALNKIIPAKKEKGSNE